MALPTLPTTKNSLITVLQARFNAFGSPSNQTPLVEDAYPQSLEQIQARPILSVQEVSSRARQRFIGGQFTEEYNQTTQKVTSTHGYIEEVIFEIVLWAINKQLRDIIAFLTKHIFNMEDTTQAFLQLDIPWAIIESGGDDHVDDDIGARVMFTKSFKVTVWDFITEQKIADAITCINAITNIEDPEE